MGAEGMRSNPFPNTFTTTGALVRDSTRKSGTKKGGTVTRNSRVVDDYYPDYEPNPQAGQGAGAGGKKSSGDVKNRGQHNPTYIDDVDDEFDYLY